MRKREHMAVQSKFRRRPGWALLATSGIAVALALGCNAHPGEHQRDVGASVIPLSLPENLGEPDRPIVEFPHDSHVAALENEGCQACHPSGADGALSFDFERSEAPGSKDALMELYHDSCMGCHEQRGQAAQRTGPLACAECHLKQNAGRSLHDPMRFDYSLHGRHSQAEQDKCENCHHVYNEEKQALEYRTLAPHARQGPAAAEPQRLQVGQPEATHRPRHVAQRVAPRVTVCRLVGRRSDAHAVQHDESDPARTPLHPPRYSRVARMPRRVSAS